MIAELFCSHILKMNRSSLLTRNLGIYATPFLDSDKRKWLYGPEEFPGLSRTGP